MDLSEIDRPILIGGNMKEMIKVEKEIETDGKYCNQSCDGYIVDYPVAECGIFNYALGLLNGKVLRCSACLKASGIE